MLFNHEYHSPSQNDIIKSRSMPSCQVSPLYFRHNKNESSKIRMYDNTVVHPYYIQLLKKYTGLPIGENGEGITEELAARIRYDSDMSYIARLTALNILERNYQRGESSVLDWYLIY